MKAVKEGDALDDLRRARRKNRLADLDWFEAAYRVYLVAFGFGGLALWASSYIKDGKISETSDTWANILHYGPAVLGMFAVASLAAGLRSGSRGGPLAIEEADVRHVLLSPIDRRKALMRPAVQRLRSSGFFGALIGALAGQLAGKRLPGSDASWVFAGAAFGLMITSLFVASALVAHALRIPRWLASGLGALLLVWQGMAIAEHVAGPGNLFGSLALWGRRQRGIDAIAIVATIALAVAGLMMLRRTSVDALARRSSLVAQLHFAVTMQDLRTVILLRRQLSQENTRGKPWFRLRKGGKGSIVWRRDWHSLFRFPVSRLLRMTVFVVGAAACQVVAFNGTSAMFLVSGGLLFLLGMETLEPLSQEIDQPDRLASLPHLRGDVLVRHVIVPSIALIPFAALGVVATVVLHDKPGTLVVASILALPAVWLGAAGAAVSIVKDAPDISKQAMEQTMMPPEMSGLTTVIRTLIPLVVAFAGSISVLLVRAAQQHDKSVVGTAVQAAVGQLLFAVAICAWIRNRDKWRLKFRAMMAEGRDNTAQQRAARATTSRSSP